MSNADWEITSVRFPIGTMAKIDAIKHPRTTRQDVVRMAVEKYADDLKGCQIQPDGELVRLYPSLDAPEPVKAPAWP